MQLCQLTTSTPILTISASQNPIFRFRSWQLEGLPFNKVCQAIDKLKKVIKKQADLRFKVLYSLMLNVLTTSDAYASKNAPEGGTIGNPHATNLTPEELTAIKNQFPFYSNEQLRDHSFVPTPNEMQQDILRQDSERIILNAGCGEGKTAAALLLAQKLLSENRIDRIIFTLPTKFTANNLNRDLTDKKKYAIPEELVGITHGDASEFLRQRTQETNEEDTKEDEIENLIMEQVFENSIYAKPITISTVDHLIMSLYHGYRFADRAFSNIASSLVVLMKSTIMKSTLWGQSQKLCEG